MLHDWLGVHGATQDRDTVDSVLDLAEKDCREGGMLLAQKCYAEGSLALVLYAAYVADEAARLHAVDAAREHEPLGLLDLLTPVAKLWPSESESDPRGHHRQPGARSPRA